IGTLPSGPWLTDDRKVALPPRSELSKSMESVIHHFRLVSEGFKGPVGDVYAFVESPRGELGFYLVSDGTNKPYRMKVRPPSFCNLQALRKLVQGVLVADVIAIMGSLDFILGDCDRSWWLTRRWNTSGTWRRGIRPSSPPSFRPCGPSSTSRAT